MFYLIVPCILQPDESMQDACHMMRVLHAWDVVLATCNLLVSLGLESQYQKQAASCKHLALLTASFQHHVAIRE